MTMNDVWNNSGLPNDNKPNPPGQPPLVQDAKWARKCKHKGIIPILIGGYEVHLAGSMDGLDLNTIRRCDYIYSLNGTVPQLPFGEFFPLVDAELRDRGGVPKEWEIFIDGVIEVIKAGKRIMFYCSGGHGRTGTMGASLIAKMEPDIEDPVAEIRKRHCEEAVESKAQVEAIFALKGQLMPAKYEEEFKPKVFTGFVQYGFPSKQSSGNVIPSTHVHTPNQQGTPVTPPLKKNVGGSSSTLVDSKTLSADHWNHENWCCCPDCLADCVCDAVCIGYDNNCACVACVREWKLFLYNRDQKEAVEICEHTKMDKDRCVCTWCVVEHSKKENAGGASRDHSHPFTCDCDTCEEYFKAMETEAMTAGFFASSRFVN